MTDFSLHTVRYQDRLILLCIKKIKLSQIAKLGRTVVNEQYMQILHRKNTKILNFGVVNEQCMQIAIEKKKTAK